MTTHNLTENSITVAWNEKLSPRTSEVGRFNMRHKFLVCLDIDEVAQILAKDPTLMGTDKVRAALLTSFGVVPSVYVSAVKADKTKKISLTGKWKYKVEQ